MKQKLFFMISIVQILVLAVCMQSCGKYSLVDRSSSQTNGYLIKNVSVFTAIPERPLLENVYVYIKNNTIEKISAEPFEAAGAEVIDGKGKTLLPGLIDFHTHISSGAFIPWKPTMLPTMDFNFEACLYSGITAVVDMGGKSPSDMYSIAGDIEAGKKLAPHLFFPGIGFSAPGSHPFPFVQKIREMIPFFLSPFVPDLAYAVESENDMKNVDAHLQSHPDFTKVFIDDIPLGTPKMSLPVLKEIVRRSHERKIPVIIHIGRNEDLKMIIDSGADGAAHNVYKERLDPAIAKELARKHIFVIPTIFVWNSYDLFVNKHSTTHYTKLELETIHPARKEELMHPFPDSYKETPKWDEWDKVIGNEYVANLYPNLAILKEAGVVILAGTDTPSVGMSPGGSLHVELEHLVKGGLTPAEALIAGTSAPAKILREVLHREINFGTVEEGRSADLLLVEGNPVKKITDTQNIFAVFYQGKRLGRTIPQE